MEFSTIAILLVSASIFGVIARILKQPVFVGYIIAGILLSILGFSEDIGSFDTLAQVGVTLLLFLLGLEMRFSDIKSFGRIAFILGIGQMLFTFLVGFVLLYFLNFPLLPATYMAIALTFSSTIIIIKILSEKKDLQSLYGRITVGYLLVQDFVAIGVLMFVNGLSGGEYSLIGSILILAKALGLILIIWFLSKKVLPRVFEFTALGSSELLFIVSIAWAVGVSAFVAGPLNFSPEIGGFLAGLALAGLPEHLQIASRAKPLRDFFLTIFFLVLGTKVLLNGDLASVLIPVAFFSIFSIIGKPLIVLTLMGILGYKSKTSLLVALSGAQISEFSFVLMAIGFNLGHVSQNHVAIIALTGVLTMTGSTYIIQSSDKIYLGLKKFLRRFERKNTLEQAFATDFRMENHVVVIGSDRTGTEIVKSLIARNREFLVVDHNPDVFKKLTANNIPCIFGDIADDDILDHANIAGSKVIISTTSNLDDNIKILDYLKSKNGHTPLFIATAVNIKQGIRLYESNASYVLIPEVVTGDYITHLLETHDNSLHRIAEMGKRHFNRLIFK